MWIAGNVTAPFRIPGYPSSGRAVREDRTTVSRFWTTRAVLPQPSLPDTLAVARRARDSESVRQQGFLCHFADSASLVAGAAGRLMMNCAASSSADLETPAETRALTTLGGPRTVTIRASRPEPPRPTASRLVSCDWTHQPAAGNLAAGLTNGTISSVPPHAARWPIGRTELRAAPIPRHPQAPTTAGALRSACVDLAVTPCKDAGEPCC